MKNLALSGHHAAGRASWGPPVTLSVRTWLRQRWTLAGRGRGCRDVCLAQLRELAVHDVVTCGWSGHRHARAQATPA